MRLKNNKIYDSDGVARQKYSYTMIALACAAIVLILAVFTIRANPQWMARYNDNRIDLTNNPERSGYQGTENADQDVSIDVPTVDSKDFPNEQENSGGQSAGVMAAPVTGIISNSHSVTVPVYSPTLEQYVIHSGIDIDAPMDTPVMAAAAGTVTKVYNDDRLGITIELTHGEGLITRYSNLSTDQIVGEGDVVEKGDVISGVGTSSLFESQDNPHLHFEVWKDGESVDPTGYLN